MDETLDNIGDVIKILKQFVNFDVFCQLHNTAVTSLCF